MRLSSQGRITIPHEIRRALDLNPGDQVDVVMRGGAAWIVPRGNTSAPRERDAMSRLTSGHAELTTAEILALTPPQ